ncbi:unnamed protein product [Clavelina lepadiformis]|uniref:Uncharacterized protein n=1 Tax=Clavelina lepadiformis TaxID=159417 RepID=A0ABP0EZA7_CLALP
MEAGPTDVPIEAIRLRELESTIANTGNSMMNGHRRMDGNRAFEERIRKVVEINEIQMGFIIQMR